MSQHCCGVSNTFSWKWLERSRENEFTLKKKRTQHKWFLTLLNSIIFSKYNYNEVKKNEPNTFGKLGNFYQYEWMMRLRKMSWKSCGKLFLPSSKQCHEKVADFICNAKKMLNKKIQMKFTIENALNFFQMFCVTSNRPQFKEKRSEYTCDACSTIHFVWMLVADRLVCV